MKEQAERSGAEAGAGAASGQAGGDDELEALRREGYDRAVRLLRACSSEHGFLATDLERDNYRRVWGRDGAIMGLAALASGDDGLIATCRRTLLTLIERRGPHGEIPSNYDPVTGRISYGGTAGRVDADLWFLVCAGVYLRMRDDPALLDQLRPVLEEVLWLLGAWEFNARGLIYVPATGDWADEYIQSGYVLYDQLLYLQAQREVAGALEARLPARARELRASARRLRRLIRTNYWFGSCAEPDDAVYHEVLFDKGRSAAPHCRGEYWMPFFSPHGYGYRFDGFANTLASLFGVADDEQEAQVDRYLAETVIDERCMLLPAFHPVIGPKDEAWEDLQVTYSHTFKNAPYEFHNGGLWPVVTGFFACSLAQRGELEQARRFLDGVHRANASEMEGARWCFPEFLHGKEHTPGGAARIGWSAAAAVLASRYVDGERLFAV